MLESSDLARDVSRHGLLSYKGYRTEPRFKCSGEWHYGNKQ